MNAKDELEQIAPQWFSEAVSLPRQDCFVEVGGAQIHYQRWPSEAKQGLLFIHGHAAHAHWWDFIAPAFSDQYQVAAIDLSGNGDSDHRSEYSAQGYAEEIVAVAKTLSQPGQSTILVGHSFGGSMTRIAAHLFPDQLAGYVLVDSVITGNRRKPQMANAERPKTKRHLYDSLAKGKRRFRLKPPQPCDNKYIVDYIAHHSLKQTIEGFEFKLDQSVFAKMIEHLGAPLPDAITMIGNNNLPSACIYGTSSRFFPDGSGPKLEQLFGDQRVIAIKAAYHHVFLDQPQAFIKALKTLLPRLQKSV